MGNILLRQLFDTDTGTYTYIIGDKVSRESIIIDSVKSNLKRDLKLLEELNLTLKYVLDTHVHADHITGAYDLKVKTNAKIVLGSLNKEVKNVDILLGDSEELFIGNISIKALLTPGHTKGCTSYLVENYIFTGDALLIRSVGRVDFQGGSSKDLYTSIQKLYTLPDETIVFVGHNYIGLTQSTISEEKECNVFIKENTTLDEFTKEMEERKLPQPKYIDIALPANLVCGKE